MMHVGKQVDKSLSISIENPDVLMISPDVLMISPDVMDTPRCTYDIPPMYSWHPPDVLTEHPRCTEHP